MADYQIYFRDPYGNLITDFSVIKRLEYARGENQVGYLYLDLDPNIVDRSIFRADCLLEPWRTVGAMPAYLDGESAFFLRKWGFVMDANGMETFHLEAYDGNYLLESRIVAEYNSSTKAKKTAVAIDNIMKAIVREQMGALATDTTRDLSNYGLTVQADLTLAPTTTKEYSHMQLPLVLSDLANESLLLGTYLAYDVVYNGPAKFEFRTYTGQRGQNRGKASNNILVVSRDRKNLEEPALMEDHSQELTYIYAMGVGKKGNRPVVAVSNAAAMGLSPYNRREEFFNASNTGDTASITSGGNAELYKNRARKTITGRLVETDGCMYGIHYRYGDLLCAEYQGISFDAHMDYIHVTYQDGVDVIDNRIKAEST